MHDHLITRATKKDDFQHNEESSCTSASVLQEIHVLLSHGNCRLSFFFKVKEAPSDLSSHTVFMVPIPSLLKHGYMNLTLSHVAQVTC